MYQHNSFRRDRRMQDDPFRHFLFGNSPSHNRKQKNVRQREQRVQQKQERSNHKYQDDTGSSLLNPASIEKYLNNIDIELLNENIDTLLKTAKQFKPLYNELTPIIMKFLDKK